MSDSSLSFTLIVAFVFVALVMMMIADWFDQGGRR